MLRVIKLNVVVMSVIKLKVVVMMSVIILNVVIPSVVSPFVPLVHKFIFNICRPNVSRSIAFGPKVGKPQKACSTMAPTTTTSI